MSQFSASDAALTGFRVATQHPIAIAIWAAGYLALSLVTGWLTVSLGPDVTQQMMDLAQQDPATVDVQAMMALYAKILPTYGAIMLCHLVYYSIAQPAAYRAVLRPEKSAFGYLRIGPDELRQLVVNIVLSLVLMAVYLGSALVVGLAVGALQLAIGGGQAAQVLGAFVAIVLILGVTLVVGVRLSLAGPQTLAEGRIRLFDSWRLTKGQFWNVFGCYAIALILSVIVTLLGLTMVYAAAAVLGGGMQGIQALSKPDLTSVATYFTPLMLVAVVLMSVISAMALAIMLTPPAEIYRNLARGRAEP